jgi:hypothetical protein
LGNIAAFHYLSVFGMTGTGDISDEEFSELRSQASTGDYALFIRRMVAAAAARRDDPEAVDQLLYGTEVRKRHSANFKKTFARLLEAAETVDTEDMVRNALLEGSAAGLYYRILRHVAGEEAMNPISGLRTASATAVSADAPDR